MVLTILKNNIRQWGSDDIPYIMENKIHVPVPTNQIYSPIINHYQPLLTMINHH